MKKKTLYLEINKHEDQIEISLRNPDSIIWKYSYIKLNEGKDTSIDIDQKCKKLINAINRYSSSNKKQDSLNEIKSLGNTLCDILISNEIKQRLIDTNAEYLIFFLDDNLVHIPWELICIGDELLCEKFRIGRVVKTRQEFVQIDSSKRDIPFNTWIIADPTDDLQCSRKEGKAIRDYIDEINIQKEKLIIDCDLDNNVTPEDFKEKIRNYDIIHYSGHSYYDSENSENSGWRLTSDNLKAHEIRKMSGTKMPLFIFSNACQSARSDKWHENGDSEQISFGLANSFILAGVRHYIGSAWDIIDKPGSVFATEFYRHLLWGESVGDAMFFARKTLMDSENYDIAWASYVLYGDPRYQYFKNDKDTNKPLKNKPQKIVGPVESRGSNTRIPGTKFKCDFPEIRKWITLFLVFIAFLIVFYNYKENVNKNEADQIKQMLIENMNESEIILNRYIHELTTKYGPIKNTRCLNISVVINSQYGNLSKEQIIQGLIELCINENTKFSPLLETTKGLIKVLQQIILQGPPIKYQLPKMMVMFDYYENYTKNKSLLLFRFIDVKNGLRTIKDNIFIEIDKNELIFKQKDILCNEIVQKLNDYSIVGKVIDVNNKMVTIDIGECNGLKLTKKIKDNNIEQKFKVFDKNIILKPISIRENTCDAAIYGDMKDIKKGLEVELIFQQ